MNGSPTAAAPASRRSLWRLVLPFAILLVEVAGITPFVELPERPITSIANARLFSGLVVSLVAFVWLTADRLVQPGLVLRRRRPVESLFWGCLHLVLLHWFVLLTLQLNDAANGTNWGPGLSAVWAILACGVAMTAYLPFLPVSSLWRCVRQSSRPALLAVIPGIAMVVLTPHARRLWPIVHGPATSAARAMLELYPGSSLGGVREDGLPTIGAQRLLLLVTPQCSEMESLLAFWLLALTLLAARRQKLRKLHYVAACVIGTVFLYCLNAGRLYALVLIGLRFSADVCVNIAHSRIGGILFLGISVVWLMCASWLCTRREPSR